MRIGVTGASGFIGAHLVKALEELPETTVVRLVRNTPGALPGLEALREFARDKDVIYHLAGVNRGTPEEVVRGNILATYHLMEAVKSRGASSTRLVFTSSSQVYKLSEGRDPIRETHPLEPARLYGLCKKTAEEIIRFSGWPYTIFRLSNVYGPGCRPDYNSVIATFCDRAVRGQPVYINGDGEQGRDFIYVDDVVRGLVLAGFPGKQPEPRIFNLSSGRLISLNQIIEHIRQAGFEVKVTYRPEADPAGPSYCCDPGLCTDGFCWKPKTSMQEGIENTLQWFKNRHRS